MNPKPEITTANFPALQNFFRAATSTKMSPTSTELLRKRPIMNTL